MTKRKEETGEEKDEEACTSTYFVILVNDDDIDIYVNNHDNVPEAVVVNPLMLQIDVALGVVASVWD